MSEYRILILAYDFPPNESIGGQRPWFWTKHLHEHSIYPVVITRHWNNSISTAIECAKPSDNKVTSDDRQKTHHIIRLPFRPGLRDRILTRYGMHQMRGLRKVLSFCINIGEHIMLPVGDKYFIYKEARRRLIDLNVDVILATGEPFILHTYARKLGKKYNKPVILDYRDGWTSNQEQNKPSFLQQVVGRIHKSCERKNISGAQMITAASPSYLKKIPKNLKNSQERRVVYNGFDWGVLEHLKEQPPNDVFTIAYAGRFYDYQRLETFLEGMRLFITHNSGAKIKAVFYGLSFYPEMVKRLLSYHQSLTPHLEVTARLPYNNVMNRLHSADTLLLLSAPGAEWLSAKVFDYLPHRKPILFVENDRGVLERILQETNLGVPCDNAQEVERSLVDLYALWQTKGSVQHEEQALAYTRQAGTQELACALKHILT